MSSTVSMYLNIVIAVLGVAAGAGAYFTAVFGQGEGQIIVMTCGFALALVSAVNGVLHGASAPQAGPMLKLFKKGT